MYTLSYVLYGIGALFTISFIVFLVLFLKKKGNKKTHLIAFIASIVVAIICFGYGGYHQYDINKTISIAEDEFADNATSFTNLYKKTEDKIILVGDYVKDAWKNGGEEADDNDEEFDVDKTVNDALSDNANDVVLIENNLKKLKKYLKEMNDYDTGTYDYDAYKKAYDRLEKLANFVKNPKGTYTHYKNTYSSYKSDVESAYKDIDV